MLQRRTLQATTRRLKPEDDKDKHSSCAVCFTNLQLQYGLSKQPLMMVRYPSLRAGKIRIESAEPAAFVMKLQGFKELTESTTDRLCS